MVLKMPNYFLIFDFELKWIFDFFLERVITFSKHWLNKTTKNEANLFKALPSKK